MESPTNQPESPADDEFVQKGTRGITEVFMPHFWRELSSLSPEERASAWVGFLSAGLGQMAADQGFQMTRVMCEGVLNGIEEAIAVQRRGMAKPSSLVSALIDRSKKV